jgi:hypothetical protein
MLTLPPKVCQVVSFSLSLNCTKYDLREMTGHVIQT